MQRSRRDVLTISSTRRSRKKTDCPMNFLPRTEAIQGRAGVRFCAGGLRRRGHWRSITAGVVEPGKSDGAAWRAGGMDAEEPGANIGGAVHDPDGVPPVREGERPQDALQEVVVGSRSGG